MQENILFECYKMAINSVVWNRESDIIEKTRYYHDLYHKIKKEEEKWK